MGIKYSTVVISGYNSAPPSDSGAQTDENKIKWSTHKIKLGDPLNNAIVAIDSALVTAFAQEALLKTTNYTTTAGDHQKLLEVTGTNTISLYDASTGGAGYQINVLNTGVAVVTVGRATAGNTINGVAGNWTLNPGNGASFRVNSTNNGYDVIATALSTGAGLADVLHTTGNETKAGVLTLTGVPLVSMPLARIDFKDTSQTLPAGLFAWQSTANTFRIIRNLAAAGDFSSATFPVTFGTTDIAIFSSNVGGADGTAPTHFVTKGQLDAKVYGGQVSSVGGAVYLPSGWSSSRTALGNYTVTHNLGTTSYAPVITAAGGGTHAAYFALATNSFQVATTNTGSLVDAAFAFTVARN